MQHSDAGQASDGVLRERLAVLGSPIAHSKSPAIHAAAYAELGLDWAYDREQLDAEALEAFLASRGPAWRGFSLTMPLKEEAHRIATVLDPIAEESGVVNTLLRIASGVDGPPRWAGFNTDVPGLAAAIRGAGLDVSRTVVLGSGATAVSALLAARSLGARRVTVAARRPAAAAELAARFDGTSAAGGAALEAVSVALPGSVSGSADGSAPGAPELDVSDATLVVSALPGQAGADLALPERITSIPLFDVAYDPWPSPLAERWRAAGGAAHPGTEMLVEQALIQVRIFRGGDPGAPLPEEETVLAAMRAAV